VQLRENVHCCARRLSGPGTLHKEKHRTNNQRIQKGKQVIKPSKAVIAGAAVTGLLTGSLAVRTYAATMAAKAGVSLHSSVAAEDAGKHSCAGKNACKGQGGCKTGDNGCKGKNSCKGQGGCATDGSKPQPQLS
jgi:hypothetical protein